MSIQIIMFGKDPIKMMEDNDLSISSYSAVYNKISGLPFMYYHTDKPIEFVLQDAVKSASSNISHILYLSTTTVLVDATYKFMSEMEFDMFYDTEVLEKCNMCLVKVTKESRVNFLDVTNKKQDIISNDILLYNPSILTMTTQLFKKGCHFNDTVKTIHTLHTVKERATKTRIFIGTPCFGAVVSCNYTSALISTIELLKKEGIEYVVRFLPNQIVTRARNILAYEFLSSNCTHLLFIDADIQWKPDDVIKLISHKKELCVGLYANKAYLPVVSTNPFKQIQYSSTLFPKDNMMNNQQLMQIKHGATGFMLINRCVFEKVIDLSPPFKYNGYNMNDFFPCKVVDGEYLTEDYAFCQMWRKKEGEIWADLSICLNHEGWHSYHGNPLSTFDIVK
jgi:hypothetical protein